MEKLQGLSCHTKLCDWGLSCDGPWSSWITLTFEDEGPKVLTRKVVQRWWSSSTCSGLFACFDPHSLSHSAASFLSLEVSVVPEPGFYEPALFFSHHSISSVISLYLHEPRHHLPKRKKMEHSFQHTRPTNCLIFLQRISCPTFLSVHCAVKRMQACTRLSSLIEAGSYLTAVTTYDYRCDAPLLDLSRWFQPASLICLKFHSKWGCLQGFLVRSDLMAAHKDAIVWQPWVTPDGWIHKAEIFPELHRLPVCNYAPGRAIKPVCQWSQGRFVKLYNDRLEVEQQGWKGCVLEAYCTQNQCQLGGAPAPREPVQDEWFLIFDA